MPKKKLTSKAKLVKHSSSSSDKTPADPKAESEADEISQEPRDALSQQRLLDVFRRTFSDLLVSDELSCTLQEVKQALFNRDFAAAFCTDPRLEAYAARWSPTRAFCYASVLRRLQGRLEDIYHPSPGDAAVLRVVALGGGAAEVAALGAYLALTPHLRGEIALLDSAAWGGIVSRLVAGLTTAPVLSAYASAAARASNAALLEPADRLEAVFLQRDVLTLAPEELAGIVGDEGKGPVLVTLLFTLNELFTVGGLGATTKMLLALTAALRSGSLLLVVDSPGSYSETVVGKQARRYPMQWLLDKILLGNEGVVVHEKKWATLETEDSVWFRLAETLEYPIPLEDMRYQMHLYQVLDTSENHD